MERRGLGTDVNTWMANVYDDELNGWRLMGPADIIFLEDKSSNFEFQILSR